jgi:deazaflavin-dependent oxidoreductase (nitroreductase family)
MTIEERYGAEQFCYLTTVGRVSGKPHEIEIWFGLVGDTLYILSGGGARSDWVKNLRREPAVRVRIADSQMDGVARIVRERSEEDGRARPLLRAKYQPGYSSDLSEWERTALPVAIDLKAPPGG